MTGFTAPVFMQDNLYDIKAEMFGRGFHLSKVGLAAILKTGLLF